MSQNKIELFPLNIAENALPIGRKNGIILPNKMDNQMPGLEEDKIGTVQFGIEQVFVVDQKLVDEGNWQMAKQIAGERSQKGKNEAFTLFNVDTVVHLFHQWRQNMPRVKPFFAVKCNNDPVLVATLAKMGAGFDCASREEIDLILDNGFGQAEDVIYANTCKTPEFIEHAQQRGINRFTFDCVEELAKMKKVHPNAEMVLRIDVTDKSAKRPLDIKFGCHPLNDAPRLLAIGKEMEMKIVGISFHVGSGCQNPFVYREAIGMAQNLFKLGEELGHRMHVLDLGGGFPGCEEEKQFFEEVSKVICEALDEFFPAEYLTANSPQRKISTDSGFGFGEEDEEEMEENPQLNEEDNQQPKLEIIAEPGRYFASSPSSVCAMVIGATRVNVQKLTKNVEDGHNNKNADAFMYYLDDGVYGSFSCLSSRLFTKVPNGKPLFPRNDDEQFPSVVWGPTCDSRDQVEQLCPKPRLQPGDWLFYSDMGAYTRVTSTNFNGFTRPKDVYYVVGKQIWDFLNCADRIRG